MTEINLPVDEETIRSPHCGDQPQLFVLIPGDCLDHVLGQIHVEEVAEHLVRERPVLLGDQVEPVVGEVAHLVCSRQFSLSQFYTVNHLLFSNAHDPRLHVVIVLAAGG